MPNKIMQKFHSPVVESGISVPAWIDVGKIGILMPTKIPGDLVDGEGNPMPKEGSLLFVDGVRIPVEENVNQVLELIPEQI